VDLFLRDDLKDLRFFLLKRFFVNMSKIVKKKKLKSTTPAGKLKFYISDNQSSRPPLLQKEGRVFKPLLSYNTLRLTATDRGM
jgi:hypothetical protein